MKPISVVVIAFLCLSACATLDHGPEPTRSTYSEPSQSGLLAVRAYPNPDDVCQVIGENALVADLLDHTALLIGCPKHEAGAIADRLDEGGVVVAHAKHWTLINMPQRGG